MKRTKVLWAEVVLGVPMAVVAQTREENWNKCQADGRAAAADWVKAGGWRGKS